VVAFADPHGAEAECLGGARLVQPFARVVGGARQNVAAEAGERPGPGGGRSGGGRGGGRAVDGGTPTSWTVRGGGRSRSNRSVRTESYTPSTYCRRAAGGLRHRPDT